MTETPPAPPPPPPASPEERPRPRRWKRILLIAGGTLAGLVLLALLLVPPIAGSVAKAKIRSLLAEKFDADVAVGRFSLGWSGRVEIEDLTVQPRGFPSRFLEVKKVDLDIALGSAIAGKYILRGEVSGARLVIEKARKKGRERFNYETEPSPGEPEKEPAEKPHVEAGLKLRGGEIVVREGGRQTVFRNVTAEVAIDTLRKPIRYGLALENPTHGRLALEGSFDPERKAGPARLTLEKISLRNLSALAAAYSPARDLEGTLEGTLTLDLQGWPALASKGSLEASGVSAVFGERPVRIDRASLTHEAALDAQGNGPLKVGLSLGEALGGSLEGSVAEAKGFRGDVALSSRLGPLGQALEKLVGLKAGLTLDGAAALRGKVEARPGSASWNLGLNAADLAAIDASGKRREIERALSVRCAGSWDGAKSALALSSFDLASSFAAAKGRGGFSLADPVTVQESSLTLKASLALLAEKLAVFLEDPPEFSGTLEAAASFRGDRFDLEAKAADVVWVLKDPGNPARVGPMAATLVQKGIFRSGLFKIESSTLSSAAADLEVKGEIRDPLDGAKREGSLSLEAKLRPEALSQWVKDLHWGGPEIRLSATADVRPRKTSVQGRTQLGGLTMRDSASGEVKMARTQPLEFTVDLEDETAAVRLKTEAFEWSRRDPASAYVARGALEAAWSFTPTVASGTTRVSRLEFGDGKKTAQEEGLTVTHELGLSSGTIEIRKAEVASGFLRGRVEGTIRNASREPEFVAVRGRFAYHPGRLGAALAPWLGGKLEGTEEKAVELALDGKAKSLDTMSILRGAEGKLEVDLAPFTREGLSVSGKPRAELKGGRAFVVTPLALNQGRADMNLAVDFREARERPRSVLEFRTEDAEANAGMGPLLEKINPIFHTVNGTVAGRIRSDFKLAWEAPIDPDEKDWVAASSKALRGSGSLSVAGLRIQGSPAVADLMAALGEGNVLEGELHAPHLRFVDGRCHYEDLSLRLKGYEVRFRGWVGFDRALDLKVDVPLTEHLKAKHPGLAKYTGGKITVPLKGTVDKPRFDLAGAIAEALKNALPGLIEEKLEDLLKRRKK